MEWNNVWSGAVGGAIVGFLVLLAEFLIRKYERKQDKSYQEIICFKNEARRVTGSVFNYLAPGASIEIMKGELGPPNKKWMSNPELFVEEDESVEYESKEEKFHTYLYLFKNAYLKVLSEDNQTIDVLTVIALEEGISIHSIPLHADGESTYLNLAKVDEDLLQNRAYAEHFPGCRDIVTAIRIFLGNPFWTYVTYFCNPEKDVYGVDLNENPATLLGAVIVGVCLAREPEHPTYIYTSELI